MPTYKLHAYIHTLHHWNPHCGFQCYSRSVAQDLITPPETPLRHLQAGFSHNAIRPRSFSYYASAKHGQSPVQLENWSVAGPSPAAPNSSTAALVLLSLQSSSRPWNYIMCLPPEALLRIMLSRGVTLSDVATWLRPSGDIFSLGLTMWCILTKGSTPKGGTPESPCVLDGRLRRHPGMLAAHRLKQMRERKLSEDPVWGRLPWDLQRMLTWMLEKSPGRRATARQLMECSFVRRSVLGECVYLGEET